MAYACLFIGAGLGGIVVGHWMDRNGMGWPALVASVMVGSGALLVAHVTQAWQLYLAYGVMIGFLGQGALFTPLMANASHWFNHRRGMAIGVVASGQSLAGALWPPTVRYMHETLGWREAFFEFGVFALAVMLPLSLVFWRRPPEQPFAAKPVRPSSRSADGSPMVSGTVLQATLCVAILGCCVAMSLPLAHLAAHVSDLGHPLARGAEMLSVALLCSFFSRIWLLGYWSERYGGLGALFLFSCLQAIGVVSLGMTQDLVVLYVIAAMFGIGYGGIIPAYPVIVREYLPAHQAGRRSATVILFGAIGMALGGWLGGVVFDSLGHYGPAFVIGALCNLLNLAIVGSLIQRRRRGRLQPVAG